MCRSGRSDMDLSGISVTVDDCLDEDQACILSVAKMFDKACQHRTFACNKVRFSATRSIHFTLIVQ